MGNMSHNVMYCTLRHICLAKIWPIYSDMCLAKTWLVHSDIYAWQGLACIFRHTCLAKTWPVHSDTYAWQDLACIFRHVPGKDLACTFRHICLTKTWPVHSELYAWQRLGMYIQTYMPGKDLVCTFRCICLAKTWPVHSDIYAWQRLGLYIQTYMPGKNLACASSQSAEQSLLYRQSKFKIRHFFQPKNIDVFLISPQKHMLWYSLEVPHWGISNEYPQYMFLWRNIFFPDTTSHLELWAKIWTEETD